MASKKTPPFPAPAAAQKPEKPSRMVPRVKHEPNAVSPLRSPSGQRLSGRDEIDPSSIPRPERPKSEVGDNPLTTILVMERSRDGRTFRYRLVDVHDPASLAGIGDELFCGPSVRRSGNAHAYRRAIAELNRLRARKLGIPNAMKEL